MPPVHAVLVQRGRPGAETVHLNPAMFALLDTVERAIQHERTDRSLAPSWTIKVTADDLDPLLCFPNHVTTPWLVGIMRVRV